MAVTLGELAARLGARLQGDPEVVIESVAALDRAGPGQLAFLSHARFKPHLRDTSAAAVILSADDLAECPVAALVTANPYLAYARACSLVCPEPTVPAGIHPSAVVDPDAEVDESASIGAQCVVASGCRIGASVVLGPGCILGPDCRVGEGTRLVARVTLGAGTCIGKRTRIQPGAVLGADGFGFARGDEGWERIPQLGGVVVGDDVEIGANTTVDRGSLGDTVIGDGVKVDNLVQVAHNVRIGAHTIIAGCVGIAGSAQIGRNCAIAGGAGIIGHVDVADGVTVTAMTFVNRPITESGTYGSGLPHAPMTAWNRTLVRLRTLDDLFRRTRALERRKVPDDPNC